MADAIMIRRPQVCLSIGCSEIFGGTELVHTYCSRCGKVLEEEHTYSSLASSYTWSDDHSECSLEYSCSCGYSEERDVEATEITITAPTCTETGTYVHEADSVVCGETHILPATGHSYGTPSYTYSDSHQYCYGIATCSTCGATLQETATGTYHTAANATCTTGTKYDYQYTWNNSLFTKTSCPDYHYKDDALGHDAIYGGTASAHQKCSRCGTVISSEHRCSLESISPWQCTNLSATLKLTCECGYYTASTVTTTKVVDTVATCTVSEKYHHQYMLSGGLSVCGTTHTGSTNSSNHANQSTTYPADLEGHTKTITCSDCDAVISEGTKTAHTYTNLQSVSSSLSTGKHIGRCSVCGYAAYQYHYSPNYVNSSIYFGQTYVCSGCGLDSGVDYTSTTTSPFTYKKAPPWTSA